MWYEKLSRGSRDILAHFLKDKSFTHSEEIKSILGLFKQSLSEQDKFVLDNLSATTEYIVPPPLGVIQTTFVRKDDPIPNDLLVELVARGIKFDPTIDSWNLSSVPTVIGGRYIVCTVSNGTILKVIG